MHRTAPFALTAWILAAAPSALAQVTTHTTFTVTDPVYQLPVAVDVAVTTNPALPYCSTTSGYCWPTRIEYNVSTLGLLFDAQVRFPRGTATFDPQQHYEKLTSSTSPQPGQFLQTTIYRLTNTFPDNTQTRLEIRCQRLSTIVKAYAPQGVSITYSVVGLTSVSYPITAASCPPM